MPQKELRDFFFDVLECGDVSGFEICIHEDFIYIFVKQKCSPETSFVTMSLENLLTAQ